MFPEAHFGVAGAIQSCLAALVVCSGIAYRGNPWTMGPGASRACGSESRARAASRAVRNAGRYLAATSGSEDPAPDPGEAIDPYGPATLPPSHEAHSKSRRGGARVRDEGRPGGVRDDFANFATEADLDRAFRASDGPVSPWGTILKVGVGTMVGAFLGMILMRYYDRDPEAPAATRPDSRPAAAVADVVPSVRGPRVATMPVVPENAEVYVVSVTPTWARDR